MSSTATPAGFLLSVGLLAGGPVFAAEPAVEPRTSHEAHDLATLRRRIPLYAGYSDQQINDSMARMVDSERYLSPDRVRSDVGILALGHGYGDPGNDQFIGAYRKVATVHRTAAGLGMAMMGSGHIQAAIDKLEKAGAKIIVALPTEVGDDTSLIRQWRYIFGDPIEASYLDVPRVKSKAIVVLAPHTPIMSPIAGRILTDFAKAAVREPAREAAILIVHGPEDPADNVKLMKVMADHAATVKLGSGLSEARSTASTAIEDAKRDKEIRSRTTEVRGDPDVNVCNRV